MRYETTTRQVRGPPTGEIRGLVTVVNLTGGTTKWLLPIEWKGRRPGKSTPMTARCLGDVTVNTHSQVATK